MNKLKTTYSLYQPLILEKKPLMSHVSQLKINRLESCFHFTSKIVEKDIPGYGQFQRWPRSTGQIFLKPLKNLVAGFSINRSITKVNFTGYKNWLVPMESTNGKDLLLVILM